MNNPPPNLPNLSLLYGKILAFDEWHPDNYFESFLTYISGDSSLINQTFNNFITVFADEDSLLNALEVMFLLVRRIGVPAFFALEDSKVFELNLDLENRYNEILELKRILKYCLDKLRKMQIAPEITPNIANRYEEFCQLTNEELPMRDKPLTEFEMQYSDLAVKFEQVEKHLEGLIAQDQANNNRIRSNVITLLEQIDTIIIQPDWRFTKVENELILKFFHVKNGLFNKIYTHFHHIEQEYKRAIEEKKGQKSE